MPESALTIASLIRDPSLQQACSRWLVGGVAAWSGWIPLPTPGGAGPATGGIRRRAAGAGGLSPEDCRAFGDLGLLMPAVVIGGVGGKIELHEAEVHLPPISLSSSATAWMRLSPAICVKAWPAPSSPAGQSTETPDRWKLANRLKGRVGFVGVFYKRDPARFLRNLSEREREDLIHSLERTYRDLLLSYFRDPAAANQALESFVNTAFSVIYPLLKLLRFT